MKSWVLVISKKLKDSSTIILWHVLSFSFAFSFLVLESCGHIPKLILRIATLRINKKQSVMDEHIVYTQVLLGS
jgi:hypothetical protein